MNMDGPCTDKVSIEDCLIRSRGSGSSFLASTSTDTQSA